MICDCRREVIRVWYCGMMDEGGPTPVLLRSGSRPTDPSQNMTTSAMALCRHRGCLSCRERMAAGHRRVVYRSEGGDQPAMRIK